jgi:sigma-E factor negative regulatory protein RseC
VIEETALVVSVQGDLAEVRAQRQAACGGCSARGGCGSHIFSSLFGKRSPLLTVYNGIQAAPGERVVIGVRENQFLRAAFALYALPLLALLGGAISGEAVAARLLAGMAELGALAGGLLGLIAGLGWVRRFSRTASQTACQAVILRRSSAVGVSVSVS